MKNAIEVRKLTKKYNNGFKLDKIDIEIPTPKKCLKKIE